MYRYSFKRSNARLANQMFTIEILSGFCNVLKSFITAMSIGPTNIRCRNDTYHPTNYSEILDDSHICHGSHEYGQPFSSCRFLILKSEEEQNHLNNEINASNHIDFPADQYPNIQHLFLKKNIDWFFDRSLICDKVYNRIVGTIDRIKWHPTVLSEVDKVEKSLLHPVLTINVRTWTHRYDPPGLTRRTDEPVRRKYDFETYKKAIETFLPRCKSVVLSVDNDAVLPEYLELLKDHTVIIYARPEGITELQYAAVNMLISSKCDFLVCSRLSTFSECIWWFSKCKQEVLPLF